MKIIVFEAIAPKTGSRTPNGWEHHIHEETFRSWKSAWKYFRDDLGHSRSCLATQVRHDTLGETSYIWHENYRDFCACSRRGQWRS